MNVSKFLIHKQWGLSSNFKMKSQSKKISVVIPSRAKNLKLLHNLFSCLDKQSFKDFEIVVVCDREFTDNERNNFKNEFKNYWLLINFFSHKNSSFVPHSEWGASYVRNFWIDQASWDFIQLFDDDNEIDSDYLKKALAYHDKFKKWYSKEVFITPTLLWRNTTKIQNQWFSWYKYWEARPQIHFLEKHQEYAEIKMFSWNGIFWKREIMKTVRYDEKIAWIAEDLDFVYSIREKGYPILVFRDLKVYHQERDKTYLEEAWIWNAWSSYQKIRNIFLRWKKHANFQEKLILLLWSTWGISIRLSIKAYLYWDKDKREIIKGIWKWYLEGRKLILE